MPYLAGLFLLEQFFFGIIAVSFFDKKNLMNLPEKIAGALVAGSVLGFSLILVLSLLAKNLETGIILGALIELALVILRIKTFRMLFSELRQKIRSFTWKNYKITLAGALLFGLLVFVWLKVLFGVLAINNGELKSILIGWGDTAYHLSMIEHFAKSGAFSIDQPILAGTPLAYPFLINLASAILLKLNLGIISAFYIPLIILGFPGILLLFSLAFRIFKSAWLAFAVMAIILFGSGLGFLQFFDDAQSASATSPHPFLETLADPPHEYTHLDMRTGGKPQGFDSPENIVWIVPAISFLSHQRSFVFGFGLFALFFLLFWLYHKEKYLWRLGIISGLAPLTHGHTFLAMAMSAAGWLAKQKNNLKYFLAFGATALIVALPSLAFINQAMNFAGENIGKSFFKLQFGWMTCKHAASWISCVPAIGTDTSAFWFWSKNFGVVFWIWSCFIIYLAFKRLKYFWGEKPKPDTDSDQNESRKFLAWIAIPSFFLFAVPNLLILQPWEFDNNKILFYWWIMAAFIVIGVLNNFVRSLRGNRLKIAGTAFACIAVFLGIFSGLIDIQARILNPGKNQFGYWGEPQKNLASWAEINTPPDAIFLTGQSPTSSLAMIAGRRLYLGYTGWLWSQGIDFSDRENKIRRILASGDVNLACGEKIGYILKDDDLLKTYPFTSLTFLNNLEKVYQDKTGALTILKLDCGAGKK